MLQVRQLCKEYRTGDLVQKALDHVDLNLRDNEFGQSWVPAAPVRRHFLISLAVLTGTTAVI